MVGQVLVLGGSGRFGRAASHAFETAGWRVRLFDRSRQGLLQAAIGSDVIVNGWNPPYTKWEQQMPALHRSVIDAASRSGSTVLIPGNVYVFGPDTPQPWGANSPHIAANPLGQLRVQMEAAYRDAGVKTILLRAGDFLDTEASGNWFDAVITRQIRRGKIVYPGATDISHVWAYLPDLARAAVALATLRHELPVYSDIQFPGYEMTGRDLANQLNEVLSRPASLKQMNWLSLHLARPFWPMAKHLLEMRYLWDVPHRLDGSAFEALLPDFEPTPVAAALRTALPQDVLKSAGTQIADTVRIPGRVTPV